MVTRSLACTKAVHLVCTALMIGFPGLFPDGWCVEATVDAIPLVTIPQEAVARIANMALPELVETTAGGVSDQAVGKHAGDFAAYWTTCQKGREGKAFEAVICDTHNRRAAASGSGKRLVPMAAVGQPQAPADLLLVGADGSVLKRAQAKSGVGALIDAIDDQRFSGMDPVTPRESYDALRLRLAVEIEHAARRGVGVTERWARVREAVESGRVWRSLPCGAPLPERWAVDELAHAHYRLACSRKTGQAV